MRNQKALRKAMVAMKTKKLMAALEILQVMALQVDKIYGNQIGAHHRATTELSADKILELRRVFDSADLDGNGFLTGSEMKLAMIEMGIPPNQHSFLSIDEAWALSFEDFVSIMNRADKGVFSAQKGHAFTSFKGHLKEQKHAHNSEKYIKKLVSDVFGLLDRDQTGSISTKKFVSLVCDPSSQTPMQEQTAMMVLREADTNGDGEVTREELSELMLKYAREDPDDDFHTTDSSSAG